MTRPIAPDGSRPIVQPGRDGGLDALRATVTLLVVFHHAALTYGAIGGWYYREVRPNGSVSGLLLILFCTVNQAWFMGLFFLIAGYLTPRSLARRGAWGYIRERLLRLGLPLLIYGFVIAPVTIALAGLARGHAFLPTLERLWGRMTFENGPLWFAQALLILGAAFVVWHAVTNREANPPRIAPGVFPSNRILILAALATGAAGFVLRLVWPIGTTAWGMQLGYFASYVVLFAAGCQAGAVGKMPIAPARQRRQWLLVAAFALPVMPVCALLAPHVAFLRGNSSGGWNVQAVVYAFWEPLVAWGTIIELLAVYQRRFARLGPLWSGLARRAFAIFIVHPPVLVVVAIAWRTIAAPPLLKFAVSGTAACLLCYGLAGLMLSVPPIRRVL